MSRKINEYTLITGVIGEDVHVTGIRIMEHALKSTGFTVYSLGIHNSQDDFIKAAIDYHADAILVSSLGGHAEILVDGFRQRCEQAGLGKIHLCLGGQLVIQEEPWETTEKRFKNMGFDRVHKPFILPKDAIEYLMIDLNIRKETLDKQPSA